MQYRTRIAQWIMILMLSLAGLSALSGCGQKGDLYLPDGSESSQNR